MLKIFLGYDFNQALWLNSGPPSEFFWFGDVGRAGVTYSWRF